MNQWTEFSRNAIEFHQTFQPTDSYITKIMELAAEKYSGTKEEISSVTGIPTGESKGKVEPHIRYAAYMGLISFEKKGSVYQLSLTDLGETVRKEDPYLFEDVTKWLCHYHLTEPLTGAYLWAFLYKVLPFQLDSPVSMDLIKRKNAETFLKEYDLGVVKRTYTEGFLQNLHVLEWDSALTFQSNVYRDEWKIVYAYSLLMSWELVFPNEQELTVEQLMYDLAWGKRFGFDETEIMIVLDELEANGIVHLNRQLHPCTVIRSAEAKEIIPDLYAGIL